MAVVINKNIYFFIFYCLTLIDYLLVKILEGILGKMEHELKEKKFFLYQIFIFF